jgi:hypothetical protein
MRINHTVEKPDGSVVFQGVLEGQELGFVIEMGLEAIIAAGGIPFVSTKDREVHDLYQVPDMEQ